MGKSGRKKSIKSGSKLQEGLVDKNEEKLPLMRPPAVQVNIVNESDDPFLNEIKSLVKVRFRMTYFIFLLNLFLNIYKRNFLNYKL